MFLLRYSRRCRAFYGRYTKKFTRNVSCVQVHRTYEYDSTANHATAVPGTSKSSHFTCIVLNFLLLRKQHFFFFVPRSTSYFLLYYYYYCYCPRGEALERCSQFVRILFCFRDVAFGVGGSDEGGQSPTYTPASGVWLKPSVCVLAIGTRDRIYMAGIYGIFLSGAA